MNQTALPLRPRDQRWLIEAEIVGAGAPGWTRQAVLAPTSKAAAFRASKALGAELHILGIRRDHEANLGEESKLLAQINPDNPVARTRPIWSDPRHVPLSSALAVTTAPPPAAEAWGIDLLPDALRKAEQTDRIYAVLDGAAIFGLAERLEGSGLSWKCLFQGDAARRHAAAAPYLVELAPDNSLARKLLRPVGSRPVPSCAIAIDCGIFLSCPVSLEGIWRHLRKFTMLADPEQGNRLFFRFYDPLIFRTLVVNMAPNDLATFCTGIRAMAAVNAAGGFTMITRPQEQI